MVVAAILFSWVIARFGLNEPPSTSGDEPSYDSIAWELSRGNGYSIDYTDPGFRAPYEQAAVREPTRFSLPFEQSGPVAFRPPLMPTVTMVGNLMFGRQFFALRSLNILLMAASTGLLAFWLCRSCGPGIAVVAVGLMLMDVRTRLYARALLTESIACFLATLLTLLLLRCVIRLRQRDVVACGLLTGLSVLTRSITALWIPGLALMIFFLTWRVHRMNVRRASLAVAVFAGCTLLVVLPWATRNIILLDSFAPLGTQGRMEMSAGYSDAAWEHAGVWQNLEAEGFFADRPLADVPAMERERQRGDDSVTRAVAWIRSHPARLPALAMLKIYSEFRPNNAIEGIVLIFALIGILTTWNRPGTRILAGLLATNAFAVAVTWSVQGRFLVPQLFVLYALCGAGINQCLNYLSARTNSF